MNNRIKELRQSLNLTLEKFGEALGVKPAAISKLENGTTNLTDTMIKLICLTYNVNEQWLRDGVGNMFNNDFLDSLKEKYNLSDLAINIIKEYIKLNSDNRLIIDNFISNACKHTDTD